MWEGTVSGQNGCKSREEGEKQEMRWTMVEDLFFIPRRLGSHGEALNGRRPFEEVL